MKVVINTTPGDLSISRAAVEWLAARGCQECIKELANGNKPRWGGLDFSPEQKRDGLLVECVEALGAEVAGGASTQLKIINIPDDINYYVALDSLGKECVHENHHFWYG